MQTENLEGQESIFDRDSACGKMSSVLSQVGGTLKRVKKSLGRIFKKSSKRSSKLKNHIPVQRKNKNINNVLHDIGPFVVGMVFSENPL